MSVQRSFVVAALLGGVLAGAPAAHGKAEIPCRGGRFLFQLNQVVGGSPADRLVAIAVDPSEIAMSIGCKPVRPGFSGVRNTSRINASWPPCSGIANRSGRPARVKLVKGLIAGPTCDRFTGTLVVTNGRPRRRPFVATLSTCNDGRLDTEGGEQCDGSLGCAADEHCTDACVCESSSPTTTVVSSTSTSSTSTTAPPPTTTTTSTTRTTTTAPTTSTTRTTTTTTSAPTTSTTRTTTTTTTTTSTPTTSTTRTTTTTTSIPTTSTTRTTTTTTSLAPTTTTTTSRPPTTTTVPGGGGCTEILGFSQTGMVCLDPPDGGGGFFAVVGHGTYQVRACASAGLAWMDPNYPGWGTTCPGQSRPALNAPCSPGLPIDRVLLTISIPSGIPTVAEWVSDIRTEIAVIRTKYAALRQIILQPVVGGPNNSVCQFGGSDVHASVIHPAIDQAIAIVAQDAADLAIGYSPEVDSCSDYIDNTGHLGTDARTRIGRKMGTYYAGVPALTTAR